jgi:hypothetical protein
MHYKDDYDMHMNEINS